MKKYFVYFLLLFFIASCEKIEDDSDEICTIDCTTLSGKVYTQNNTPLKNVAMNFKFQKSDPENNNLTLTRILSKVRTNNLGAYNMNFFLKDEELGEWVGRFVLNADKNTLPSNVFYEDNFNLYDNIYNIQNRNIEIQRNLYIPTLKKVKIKLNGFNGPAIEDYFRVLAEVPCGYDRSNIDPITGNNHNYTITGLNKFMLNNYNGLTNKIFEIPLALNETNFIVVGKMKNNVYSEERIPIFITTNSNQILEFNYE
jgi:hypothetical protein